MELVAYLYQYQFQEEPKKTTELAGVPDSLTFHRAQHKIQHKISVPYPFFVKDSGVQARALKGDLPSIADVEVLEAMQRHFFAVLSRRVWAGQFLFLLQGGASYPTLTLHS
ncbi:hypothetical protein CJ030_MR2G005414 [Morella rubra]|uniref:Uncharacterized protein n=1 Tax=Morella rubra TaxID=262757 RepID=A0A6A1W844_9ROSI|nr:hypothetical protein CJ030_MR2G005414 [Morella rubra]